MIPAIDDIVKLIDSHQFPCDNLTLLSDVFHISAISISNKINYSVEREKEYMNIIKKYDEGSRKVIVEIFSMLFLILSNQIDPNIGFNDHTRTVFLNESAIYHIQEYLKSRDDDNEYLFVSLEKPHKRLKASGFEIRIRDLGREVNVKAFPHKFRHTAATWALNNGMPIEQVKEILGHESVETTLIYAKINQSELKYSHQKYMS